MVVILKSATGYGLQQQRLKISTYPWAENFTDYHQQKLQECNFINLPSRDEDFQKQLADIETIEEPSGEKLQRGNFTTNGATATMSSDKKSFTNLVAYKTPFFTVPGTQLSTHNIAPVTQLPVHNPTTHKIVCTPTVKVPVVSNPIICNPTIGNTVPVTQLPAHNIVPVMQLTVHTNGVIIFIMKTHAKPQLLLPSSKSFSTSISSVLL